MVLFGMSFSSRDIGYGDFARRFKGIRKDVPLMISVLLQRQLAHSLLSKVFLRSVIADNGLRFDADLRISEDLLFNFKYMLSAKSIAIIDKELYFVDESSNDSLTRKARDYLADELIRANLGMFASLDESGLDDDAKATIRKTLSWMFYRSAYSSCMELLKYDLTATERRRRIKYICRKFNLQKIGFHGIKGAVAALPVNLCLSFLIDLIVRFRCRRRG